MSATEAQRHVDVIERPRLLARLERLRDPGAQESMALLAAPPGFGKTTLVRSWVRALEPGVPVAVTDLRDVGDSRRTLWQRVLTAVATAVGGPVSEVVRRLPVPDRIGHDDFVTELLDVLVGVPLVLVLDDVHEVTGAGPLGDLDRLVSRAPTSLRLALLSRNRPPLPALTDRRIRGEVDVMTAADLAFTVEECAACAPDLSEVQRDRIWERTEGWPAMARLMGVTLARSEALDGRDWSGEDGLADQLFGEALRALGPDVQHVVLHCAVADPTPLDLLVALTGRDDAGELVAGVRGWSGLLREVPDPGATFAYRLHPILRAHLHAELLHRDTPAARAAETTCAAWFVSHGEGLRAVAHAVASQSLGVLERTLAAVGLGLVADGLAAPLVRVLDRRLFRGHTGPWTATVGAAALVDVGRVTEAATLLELHPAADDPELRAAQHAVESLLRRRRGRPVADPVEVVDRLTLDTEMTLALQRGAELLRSGRDDLAAPLLERAVEVAEGRAHDAALVDALTLQAACDSVSGAFPIMRERLARAHQVAEVGGWTGSPRAALMKMLEGWLAYLALDDVRARTLSSRAFELLDPEDDPSTVVAVHNLAQGVTEGAASLDTQWMHESWQADGVRLAPDLMAGVALADAQLCLHTGRADRLRETVQGLVERLGDVAETHLAAAYLALARDRPAQAAEALAPVLREELPRRWGLTPLDARVLSARVALAQGHQYQAVSELRLALDLAADLGTPRSLLGLGPDGLALLAGGRGSWGRHEALVERLLAHVATLREPPPIQLTDREIDVLRELPTLRTVEEIAGDMVISVNTLKTHLRSIYRKLGVSSRREAVSEARRAGLL